MNKQSTIQIQGGNEIAGVARHDQKLQQLHQTYGVGAGLTAKELLILAGETKQRQRPMSGQRPESENRLQIIQESLLYANTPRKVSAQASPKT